MRVGEKVCAEIKRTGQETGLALSIHAPYYINLNGDDGKWPRLRQYLMDAAHFGNLAGATDIVFHPGSYFGRPAAEVLGKVMTRLEGCVEEIRATGNPVTLRPEAMGKSAVIGSLEDILELAKIPGVMPCIDFAHLHARPGDGSMNSYEEWMDVLGSYRQTLGDEAMNSMHIHLSGIEYGPKGEKNHLAFEDADLDFTAIIRALRDSGAGGRILCESPVLEVDALKFKELLMEVSEETID